MAGVPPTPADRGLALPAALFAAGLLISGCTLLQGVQLNDEGLMLAAARRIAAGEVPYGDFWWFYPPGQPYLLAGPGGADRAVAADAGGSCACSPTPRVGVLAHRLAVRGGARPGGVPALAAWLASVLAMAYPSGPHPFPLALAFALGALLAAERRPALAGALCGLCAAWRIEFAAALGGGVALARLAGRPPAARPRALRGCGRGRGGADLRCRWCSPPARAARGSCWSTTR